MKEAHPNNSKVPKFAPSKSPKPKLPKYIGMTAHTTNASYKSSYKASLPGKGSGTGGGPDQKGAKNPAGKASGVKSAKEKPYKPGKTVGRSTVKGDRNGGNMRGSNSIIGGYSD